MTSTAIKGIKTALAIVCVLVFSAFHAKANPFQECHTFTDTSGRSIDAVVLDYDVASGKVDLKLENGHKGTVSIDQLSEDDHAYLGLWLESRRLLSNELLEINITFEDGYWHDTGDRAGDRDRREDHLLISIVNHGTTTLTNITAEYCTYRDRKEQIGAYNFTLKVGELTPSTPVEINRKQVSYKRGVQFRNILVGARFRFMMTLSDGTELIREICVPEPLPLDDYPWVEGVKAREAEKAEMPDPSDYPAVTMSEKEVRALAEQYIDAIDDEDFEAWKALLAPMHPGDSSLTETGFKTSVSRFNGVHILDVEDRNVNLRVRYKSSGSIESWLQITESGHIKYTPLQFPHPITRALQGVPFLLRNRKDLRTTGMSYLRDAGVPLFNYDLNGDRNDREDAVEKIMEWIEANGATHDHTLPKVYYPEDALNELIELAERGIENVDRRNDWDSQ